MCGLSVNFFFLSNILLDFSAPFYSSIFLSIFLYLQSNFWTSVSHFQQVVLSRTVDGFGTSQGYPLVTLSSVGIY